MSGDFFIPIYKSKSPWIWSCPNFRQCEFNNGLKKKKKKNFQCWASKIRKSKQRKSRSSLNRKFPNFRFLKIYFPPIWSQFDERAAKQKISQMSQEGKKSSFFKYFHKKGWNSMYSLFGGKKAKNYGAERFFLGRKE